MRRSRLVLRRSGFNPISLMELIPSSEKQNNKPGYWFIDGEFEDACQRAHFYRAAYNPGFPAFIHPMMCKARRCEQCGQFWAWKWRLALKEKADELERRGVPPITRAITLTTAGPVPYKQFWLALKYFWRYIRNYTPAYTRPWGRGRKKRKNGAELPDFKPFYSIQYWGVVEFNQKKTQPHIHFVIYNPNGDRRSYIPKEIIERAWIEAQKQAKFDKIAWDTKIEKIRGDVKQYFTKYITKVTGNIKDEIPPETWEGRFVRYSVNSSKRPGFFAVGLAAITAAFGLAKYFENPRDERSFCLINQDTTLEQFTEICRQEANELNQLVNQPWDWQADCSRAAIWADEMFPLLPEEKPPPSVLLRAISPPCKFGPPIPPGWYAGGAAPGKCETIPEAD